jgi:hypothetical protein
MTDIPLASSGLKPRRMSIRFEAPEKFSKLNLRLHIMSDSYIGVDWEGKIVLEVAPRSTKRSSAIMKREDVAKRVARISKSGLPLESLAKASLQYAARDPKRRKMARPCGDHPTTSKRSNEVCQLCGRKIAVKFIEDMENEYLDVNYNAQDSSKRIDCSAPVTGKEAFVGSTQDVVNQTNAPSSSAESSFTWWEIRRVVKQQEAEGLAKHTPDTLNGNYWMHMDSCDADVDCVSVKSNFLVDGEDS